MPERALAQPAVFTVPSHRSFANSLASGLIQRFGKDPLGLARGRILLPNNRAVRTVTEAFVRASGNGLLLPRLIPVGEPDLDERVGGALEPIGDGEPLPGAIDPTERLLMLASIVRKRGEASGEALRLASDLARTLDSLLIEEIEPRKLRTAVREADDLARHWEHSLERLQLIFEQWPAILEENGTIDLAERRNRLLHRLADRWRDRPPEGFTVAAGITTSAPAVTALVARVAHMPSGMVVLPGLWLSDVFPDEEWNALGPDEHGRGEATHPQYHLKQLLDHLSVARGEVKLWRSSGGFSSSPERSRALANAMAAPEFSHKWEVLRPAQRRLTGIRLAELPDPAAEAQAIALAMREALETPEKTAALVTPDRELAARVSALLARWDIKADDSAGQKLSQTAPGTLMLGIAALAAEELAPVALLALLKHPLVGGEGEARLAWLSSIRRLDKELRGPRPAAGLAGLDVHLGSIGDWPSIRARIRDVDDLLREPISLANLAKRLATAAQDLAGDRAWPGPAGRMAADLLSELQCSSAASALVLLPEDAVPVLRQLLDRSAVRPPYGGHPRIFIWGLLEARLQRADLMILGGLNEGAWPALPAPDPWLPPRIRASLNMPTLETRIGLSAHDFASALGAPEVLLTRARRDSRSPTIASRFLMRLNAMTGGLPRDRKLEGLTRALDDRGVPRPAERPRPCPPVEQRPKSIWVTSVDRLKADPYAFYARSILDLHELEPLDADHTAKWKGSEVHKVFEHWLLEDRCEPDKLRPRAEALLGDGSIHPMLRALWAPRLFEAIDSLAELERTNRSNGRQPIAAEATGKAEISGIVVQGRVDRIDRLAGGGLAIIDYKTGAPPSRKAIEKGFALQLGLLALIARAGGFEGIEGEPERFEYWSLAKRLLEKNPICADKDESASEFLERTKAQFSDVARSYLLGNEPFTAKLNPAFAPYGDYDQLMRLEEWYARK